MAEKTCQWYVTEDENDIGNYYHDEEIENGFCLMQDLFTRCEGKCNDYCKAKCKKDKR